MIIRRGTTFEIQSSSNRLIIGKRGVVCRTDKSTGFFWLLCLDLVKKDPAYRNIEFGPFCAADIPAGKLRRKKCYVPAGLLTAADEPEDMRGNFERKSTG